MPRVMLTDRLIKSLKPTTTRVEYHDALVPALVLRVMPSGVKTWALRYRHRGRPLRLTLDSIDHLSLADARDRARRELLAINNGADPAGGKRDARQAETIDDLATLYIEKW